MNADAIPVNSNDSLERLDVVLVAPLERLKVTFIYNGSRHSPVRRLGDDGQANVLKDVREELMCSGNRNAAGFRGTDPNLSGEDAASQEVIFTPWTFFS